MRSNLAEAKPMADAGVDLARECALWALPQDHTCAGVARRLLRQALERMGLPDEQIYDATVAVNELAANVYRHVLNRPRPSAVPAPRPASPELWLYRRGQNEHSQFVCKIFDPVREPPVRVPARTNPLHDLPEHGRGLTIVESLTAAWGCHLTRSRFGGRWSVPGKAVWFAMPLPHPTPHPPPTYTPLQAARALRSRLAARGIPTTLRPAWDHSTLSIASTLTVRCHDNTFTWTTNGTPTHYAFADLTEAAEQLVRLHEESLSVAIPASSPHLPGNY
ncbi:ATP-binding protein [Thermopolyspora flexuosa]|uniref:Anti-sigma regulatory factor (Ser/Thr protein kinase) n=1 Tax=Thermopolyspora flexuosa TaxID=103836 RepID=A0A543IWE9_9ACTN|nr:ATP-binding protein [Thermopolyspora flexuosa]TQM74898.1 anti-sigma regulatory factor (Ser/Thr protein kinase) [Thermopolyspora flexuosa]